MALASDCWLDGGRSRCGGVSAGGLFVRDGKTVFVLYALFRVRVSVFFLLKGSDGYSSGARWLLLVVASSVASSRVFLSHDITWCQKRSGPRSQLFTSSQLLFNNHWKYSSHQRNFFRPPRHITRAMPKHDQPIPDIQAVRAIRDHYRHWETRFHGYCLLEGCRAKDRITGTENHYIAAKRPFELAALSSAIPASEWNTLDNVIASKIPADNTEKPWVSLQKIEELTLMNPSTDSEKTYFIETANENLMTLPSLWLSL